ncbi:MAG: dipeptidase [Syntrophomonadaceae bacterium]|nr:dipeptidase [Syntrophomonadaceae bacterium]
MIICDLHCDTISKLARQGGELISNSAHFDISRALNAGVRLQFFALYYPPTDNNTALREILKQIVYYNTQIALWPDLVFPILTKQDGQNIGARIQLASILHLEGADCIGTDIAILECLYLLGIRSIGLTWNHRNLLADGVGEGQHAAGLSRSGKKVVIKMAQLGILLDLSHLGEPGFQEAIEYYKGPVLVTHANARALCNHPRNLNDSQLEMIRDCSGVIGINQVADFVKADGKPTFDDVLNHIVYIAEKIGIEHVALGSDFDGADNIVLPGIETYDQWEDALIARNFTATEIDMILGKNALRVINQILT